MTLNRKKANFRGHYVSHEHDERKFRGHLKKSRAESPFFEGQGKKQAVPICEKRTYRLLRLAVITCMLISAFIIFHCLASKIFVVSKSKISSL